MRPLNIIYIVPHDLGKELGCYGRPIPTPNLDAFAAGGVRFDNAFCNAPCCSPSRGCMYTGQYSHTNGQMGLAHGGFPLEEHVRTIVDYFNDAGYESAHVGYQHERLHAAENRYQVEMFERKRVVVEEAVPMAVEYLESRRRADRPFYLNVGTIEVHACKWAWPDNPYTRAHIYGQAPPEETFVPPYLPDTPAVRAAMGRFQACIRYYDAQMQVLFDAVRRLGYEDNTLVLFTTDHGISGSGGKGTVYDRGVEVALMLQMPRLIGRGRVVNEVIQNIDIAPTLLEAAGVPVPQAMQGRSFWPLLTGGDYMPHDAIFIERNYHGAAQDGHTVDYDPMRVVRTPQFHYIRNFADAPERALRRCDEAEIGRPATGGLDDPWPDVSLPRPPEELFDVRADPDEFHDRADDAAFADTKAELAAMVERWMQETDDPLLRGPIPMRPDYDPDDRGEVA